jgi:predicted transcriptional regulator
MKNLSLKLDDDIFDETEKISVKLKINRNRYINKAVSFYNELQKRRLLGDKLARESKLVQNESLSVLAEFEKLSDEHTAI